MKKKAVLLAFALFSLCFAGLLRLRIAYASPYTEISVATAYEMITNGSYPDLVVLDVRTKSEYDGGHIYGAVWIYYGDLISRIGELAGHENHEIIVYCECGCTGSPIACQILDLYNFTKVYDMLGGIAAWQSSGYPVWTATVHNVDTAFNYDTIQAAIDAPQTLEGHTILVDKGTYYEHVVVDKSLFLIGENRSHTVIDGNGTGNVIEITAHHVNVTGFTIRNGTDGIFVNDSNYTIISGNILTDNQRGIQFATCSCNPARENNVTNNIIKNNEFGISLGAYNRNVIYHNNFIDNIVLQVEFPGINTIWDDGYPSGGNYWSDHNPPDIYGGPYQNETGKDRIGDAPYVIGINNIDNYPLIYPYGNVPSPDLNDDGKVTITDIVICALAFGSKPGNPSWNPIADLNQDGKVTITDVVMIAIHFGETL